MEVADWHLLVASCLAVFSGRLYIGLLRVDAEKNFCVKEQQTVFRNLGVVVLLGMFFFCVS